jgi:hypothetical protein
MKKKIAADLTSLAHKILQLKKKDDVIALQHLAKELYEKLTILAFAEKHFADLQPTAGDAEVKRKLKDLFSDLESNDELTETEKATKTVKTQEKLEEKIEKKPEERIEEATAFSDYDSSQYFKSNDDEDEDEEAYDLPGIATINKMIIEMPDEVPETAAKIEIPEVQAPPPAATDMKADEEEQGMIEIPDTKKYTKNDLEEITAGFETMPVFERKLPPPVAEEKQKSLNDKLNRGLKFGINDRLGFVKNLFNGSDQDFNRVISQLNTMETFNDAQQFIDTMVKPDYNNWDGKESFANRFMELVERNY